MKKLFVSDLDGTLLMAEDQFVPKVSQENLKAIKRFVEQGNIFAIASARGRECSDEMTEILGFRPDFIGQNGTSLEYGGKYSMMHIDLALMDEFIAFMQENHIEATLSIHAQKGYLLNRRYYPYGFKNALHDADFMDLHHQLLPKKHDELIVSGMAVWCQPKDLEFIRSMLRTHFSGRLEVVSSDIDLINICPFGCTKGEGVKKLMQYYGLDIENVGVVGDSDNDISMFQAVKYSYCMEHSDPEVKQHANRIVSSVAQALDQFLDM